MHDLNDLTLFARVVEAGGYSAAERLTGIPKSRLSRRVQALEAELGVRLIQRTANRFFVTDAGQRVHRHAQAIARETQALVASVAETLDEPAGLVRLSAAPLAGEMWLAAWLAEFACQYPRVQIALSLSNRHVDLLAERFDLALRFSSTPLVDADVVARRIGQGRMVLVTSPEALALRAAPSTLADLRDWPAVVLGSLERPRPWSFVDEAGEPVVMTPVPRIVVNNVVAAREAVRAGAGVAQLPMAACQQGLADGSLCALLPEQAPAATPLYAMYPSRHGMSTAVRELLAFLEARCGARD